VDMLFVWRREPLILRSFPFVFWQEYSAAMMEKFVSSTSPLHGQIEKIRANDPS